MIALKELGSRCKRFRISRGYLQIDVAKDTGYGKENVSAFECGRNDNSRILLWYLEHGMTLDEVHGVSEWESPSIVYGLKCERVCK